MFIQKTEIRKELCFVNRQKLLHRFEFEHDLVFDEKIKSKATVQFSILVNQGNHLLPFINPALFSEFYLETTPIRRLKKSWTKMFMNLNCNPYDFMSEFLVLVYRG